MIYSHTFAYESKLCKGKMFATESEAREFDIDRALNRLRIMSPTDQLSTLTEDAIIYLAEHIKDARLRAEVSKIREAAE